VEEVKEVENVTESTAEAVEQKPEVERGGPAVVAPPPAERVLVISTNGTNVRIARSDLTTLELLSVGEMIVNTARQRMTG
jgi:hypothetical protein